MLVALREFLENVKTKGFWIGIFLFPIILMIAFTVPEMLEKATPTRYFVLVDQTGELQGAVSKYLEQQHQIKVVQALQKYIQENLKPEFHKQASPSDFEHTPGVDLEGMLDKWADQIDGFIKAGGKDYLLEQATPQLREDAPPFQEPRRQFQEVPLPEGIDPKADIEPIGQELKPYLRGDKRYSYEGQDVNLFAAVLIPPDLDSYIVRPQAGQVQPSLTSTDASKQFGIQYWSANLADKDLPNTIERSVNEKIRNDEYVAKGVNADTVKQVQATEVAFSSLNPKKEAGAEAVSVADEIRQWAPVAFVYLLWVAIFTILQMLLNNTIEEKSNRIIEVLLSSVTPGELMMGKLAGIAAVGLTMIGSWIATLSIILIYKGGSESQFISSVLQVLETSGLIPSFAVYFLFGYLMYAGIFLAIGSVCNTLKEAQNLMGPIMLIMMVPLFTMMFIPKDPNGTLATVLSWIPLYTPFIMMNRAAADPPLFDRVGTFIVLIVSTLVALWLSGKVFRIGILRTGQPPKLKEIFRWLRA